MQLFADLFGLLDTNLWKMKKITPLILFFFAFSFSAIAQTNNNGNTQPPDAIGYSFTITNGVNNADDALRLDNILLSLQDMVLYAKTDAVTKKTEVRVVDQRIVYESIKYFVEKNGFAASANYIFLDDAH